MLFSDGKENKKKKEESTEVHGFFILQSNIKPNTSPIHFELGEPKYKKTEINYKEIKTKKNGRFKDKPGKLF